MRTTEPATTHAGTSRATSGASAISTHRKGTQT
jgi:hypothetical protein